MPAPGYRSGSSTVKADRAQLRPAYGFENWTPEQEDIKALKQAEKNFLAGEVEDATGPPPPEDEPLQPEILDYGSGVDPPDPLAIMHLPEAVAAYQRSEGYGPSRQPSQASSRRSSQTPYEKQEAEERQPTSLPPISERSDVPAASAASGTKRPVEGDSGEQEVKRIAVEGPEGELETSQPAYLPKAEGESKEAMFMLEEISPQAYGLAEAGNIK